MKLNLLTFENLPIYEQLCLEEALLRTSDENWAIINLGSPKAIVMGISAKAEEVVHLSLASRDKIPLISRFSGGGTVFVDENTLFVTFIFQKTAHTFDLFPKSILNWSGSIFQNVLNLTHFAIQENDFALGNRKIGGNAQYIKKDRFLHHTSFLHDFTPENMSYLLHPPKEPSYRNGRHHLDFITPLAPHISKSDFKARLISYLASSYTTQLNPPLPSFPPHRTSTQIAQPILKN